MLSAIGSQLYHTSRCRVPGAKATALRCLLRRSIPTGADSTFFTGAAGPGTGSVPVTRQPQEGALAYRVPEGVDVVFSMTASGGTRPAMEVFVELLQ
jgi:hypothetical protein